MENIVSIFMFIFIFMLITGVLYYFLLRNKEIEKRLNYYLDIEKKYGKVKDKKPRAKNFKESLKNSNELVRALLKKMLTGGNQQKINQLLISAGVTFKPEEYLMLKIFISVVVAGCFYIIFNSLILLVVGGVVGAFMPRYWLKGRIRKRIEKFNDSLADMITTIVGSLKSGFSFSQAMKTVAEESESPVKEEIQTLLNEISYGISMEDALYNLYKRVPSVDLELMIQATLIQRQIGGNLSVILEIIVATIRERKKLERHIRTLTAQGRLSGKVISGLPVFITIFMFLFNRSYIMDFLSNTYGKIAIGVGVFLCIIGFFMISRITKIEV
ncbi:MAG: type II secretion system F family protein [Solirubrobacterales bacterium]